VFLVEGVSGEEAFGGGGDVASHVEALHFGVGGGWPSRGEGVGLVVVVVGRGRLISVGVR
jgi:hypothetical protein